MAQNLKQLGQLRPANTTAASLYSPASSTETIVKTIIISNSSAADAVYRIFNDDDGTTYDEFTQIAWDVTIKPASPPHVFEINLMMNNSSGNLAVRTDTANAITFTCWGSEII